MSTASSMTFSRLSNLLYTYTYKKNLIHETIKETDAKISRLEGEIEELRPQLVAVLKKNPHGVIYDGQHFFLSNGQVCVKPAPTDAWLVTMDGETAGIDITAALPTALDADDDEAGPSVVPYRSERDMVVAEASTDL